MYHTFVGLTLVEKLSPDQWVCCSAPDCLLFFTVLQSLFKWPLWTLINFFKRWVHHHPHFSLASRPSCIMYANQYMNIKKWDIAAEPSMPYFLLGFCFGVKSFCTELHYFALSGDTYVSVHFMCHGMLAIKRTTRHVTDGWTLRQTYNWLYLVLSQPHLPHSFPELNKWI